MRIVVVSILMLTCCGSCAFFRYHSSLVSKPDRQVKKVAVLIVVDEFANEFATNQVRFTATRAVAEDLAAMHAFDFKILERNVKLPMINNLGNNDLGYELRQNYDAYITIITHFKNSHRIALEMRESNAKGTLLIEAHYSISSVNMDMAIRGTIELFSKEWKKIQQR